MNTFRKIFSRRMCILFVTTAFLFMEAVAFVHGTDIVFTKEEKDYIKDAGVLKVVSIDGIAPLSYRDDKGNIKGIGINLFEEISLLTGLNFEFELYDSVSNALVSDFDIYTNSERKYAPRQMSLSQPYLKAETILFYNKGLNPKELEGKRFVAVAGGTLPDGIAKEDTLFLNNREDTIIAVNEGKAHYGYGNVFSVAFYTLQNNCSNIVTVPIAKEERAYCLGVWEKNDILLSILNKSIESIDKIRKDTLVLDVMSQVERRVTPSMVLDAYWEKILILLVLIFAMLGYIIFSTVQSRKRISIENERYRIIAQVSDDYLFEYRINKEKLTVSKRLNEIIAVDENENKIINKLRKNVKDLEAGDLESNIFTIRSPLRGGGVGTFRVIFSYARDKTGKIVSVIGKLVDITSQEKEREHLVAKAQIDGLTGLYNAETTREILVRSVSNRQADKIDALLVIDCDDFKSVNDKYGHLKGDEALKRIGQILKATFRQTDIIGRLGGDEFCVYMHDIPSEEFAYNKSLQLLEKVQDYNEDINTSISVGISILNKEISYRELFHQADEALYVAKRKGGSKIIVYEEEEGYSSMSTSIGNGWMKGL